MKKSIYIMAAAMLAATACTDDRNNFMVDDAVGLLNPDMVEADIYVGVEVPYQLIVIKSGKGFESADISLSVSESVLQTYNAENGTSYTTIPSECYTMASTSLHFDKSDYRKSFDITWNLSSLQSLLASGAPYALPVEIKTAGSITMTEGRTSTLIVPVVQDGYVLWEEAGLSAATDYMPTVNDNDETELYVKVITNFNNRENVSFAVEVVPELVDEYNAAHGTSYATLPSGCYSVDSKWTIPAGLGEGYVRIDFFKSGLIASDGSYLWGEYLLPIRIASTSLGYVSPDGGVKFYRVKMDVDMISKAEWECIEWNNCAWDYGGWYTDMAWGPDSLLDDDLTTYWLCNWEVDEPLPWYFVFDMAQEYTLVRFGYAAPDSSTAHYYCARMQAGYVEGSTDCVNWTRLGSWAAEYSQQPLVYCDFSPAIVRYVKFVVTDRYESGWLPLKLSCGEVYGWGW